MSFFDGYYLHEAPKAQEFAACCAQICERAGLVRCASPAGAEVAIAPRLSRKLPREEWEEPLYGTLIFHPSALPYGRGPDAIRWAMHLRERVSAATWFWCDEKLDAGPICEQQPVLLDLTQSASHNYRERFMPAGLLALERAIACIQAGKVRRVPQEEALASYDSHFVGGGPGSLCPFCGRLTAPLNYHERGDCPSASAERIS